MSELMNMQDKMLGHFKKLKERAREVIFYKWIVVKFAQVKDCWQTKILSKKNVFYTTEILNN